MPRTVSEQHIANSSGDFATGVLTATPQVGGTVTIVGQSGITATGSGNAWSIASARTCVGGAGLTMTKSGDVHTFDNSTPMTAIQVTGTVYAAGTLNEMSFPNATGTLTGQQISITTFRRRGRRFRSKW